MARFPSHNIYCVYIIWVTMGGEPCKLSQRIKVVVLITIIIFIGVYIIWVFYSINNIFYNMVLHNILGIVLYYRLQWEPVNVVKLSKRIKRFLLLKHTPFSFNFDISRMFSLRVSEANQVLISSRIWLDSTKFKQL